MIQLKTFNLVVLIAVLAFIGMRFTGLDLTKENGVLENAQILLLLFAVFVFAKQIIKLIKSRTTQPNDAALAFSLFLICLPLIGAIRELGFGANLGLSLENVSVTKSITGGIALIFFGLSFTIWITKVSNRSTVLLDFLKGATCRNLYFGIILFALASGFEQGTFGLLKSVFLEELFEFIAFSFIVRAAYYITPR